MISVNVLWGMSWHSSMFHAFSTTAHPRRCLHRSPRINPIVPMSYCVYIMLARWFRALEDSGKSNHHILHFAMLCVFVDDESLDISAMDDPIKVLHGGVRA